MGSSINERLDGIDCIILIQRVDFIYVALVAIWNDGLFWLMAPSMERESFLSPHRCAATCGSRGQWAETVRNQRIQFIDKNYFPMSSGVSK